MAICTSCNAGTDVRPYGVNGAMICFKCAMSTPEKVEQAERMFSMQLDACGPVAVVGDEVGPYPMQNMAAAERRAKRNAKRVM